VVGVGVVGGYERERARKQERKSDEVAG